MLDNEDKLARMCPACREEALRKDKCIRCGKTIQQEDDTFVNPNFDMNKYNKLANEIT